MNHKDTKGTKKKKVKPDSHSAHICPNEIKGLLEISKSRRGVFIGGDPDGLRSLAKILVWLADVDQETHPTMPDGEREHTHLHVGKPYVHLTQLSVETEVCRLDAKGTGELPDYYPKTKKNQKKK
jgi:hypothetical protein